MSNKVSPDYLYLATRNYWALLGSESMDENNKEHEPGGSDEEIVTTLAGPNEIPCFIIKLQCKWMHRLDKRRIKTVIVDAGLMSTFDSEDDKDA